MKNSVIIKGVQSGLIVVLDSNLPYDDLRNDIVEKFTSSSNFLGEADIAISFEGRNLNNDELADIIGIIHSTTKLNIVYVISKDPVMEARFQQTIEDRLMELSENTAKIHKGSVRSGQTLDSSSGLIILGDIHENAIVNASGNVLVIGSIEGTVNAGLNGNKRSFIFALDMRPCALSIANYLYSSQQNLNTKHKLTIAKKKSNAMIAYVDLGRLTISEITKEVIHELRIKKV